MSTQPRKQATRLARPAVRYWKGKAPKGVNIEESESDSDYDEEEQQELQRLAERGAEAIGGVDFQAGSSDEEEEDEEGRLKPKEKLATGQKSKLMNVALKDVNISKEGKVMVAGKAEVGRTQAELVKQEEESEEESEEEESEEEEESSMEESSEEEAPKPIFRPVFVPKRSRATIAEREALAEDTEEATKRKEAEAEERRKQSHDLVAESIRRELAEKEREEVIPDLDDTDGLSPEAEFEEWRLRELARIKRDKETALARELEREEIERRRAMPEEQRLKEDLERAEKLRADKPKGQQKFLQKYWHKGAFHQDEDILKRHDYTEATESTLDVSLLPKVMQVKNFGKRSRTKYTHLLDQDTTVASGGFGGAAPAKSGGLSTDGGAGCFNCGGPHMKKDCPQIRENGGPGLPNRPGSGANNASFKGGDWPQRSWGGPPPPPGGGRERDHDHDRPNDRGLGDGRDRNWTRDRDNGGGWGADRSGDRNGHRDDRNGYRRDENEGRDYRGGGDKRRHSRSRSRSRNRYRDRSRSPPRRKWDEGGKNGSRGGDHKPERRRSRSRSVEVGEGKRRRVD